METSQTAKRLHRRPMDSLSVFATLSGLSRATSRAEAGLSPAIPTQPCQVKALVMMHKLPAALIPRFPDHHEMLKMFVNLKAFHLAVPVGFTLEGNPIDVEATMPIFASELLDRLTSEILVPVLTFKKHQSLFAQTTPLAMPFVKDILPELDAMYAMEKAQAAAIVRAASLPLTADTPMMVESDALITKDEAEALQSQWDQKKQEIRNSSADAHVAANVVFVKWSSNVLNFVTAQPLLQDGAACLWWFSGGTDCTKDAAKRVSPWRMKAVVDEDHVNTFVDVLSKTIKDADTAVILSGRNVSFYRDIKKLVMALKPRVGIHEFVLEPDEATVCKLLRLESNAVGSVDLSENYMQVIKHPRMWKMRKATERRFVPGNTAFKAMAGVPILSRETMTLVPYMEREAIFKTIVPNDKWNGASTKKDPKVAGGSGDGEDEGEEDDVVEDDTAGSAPAVIDESTKVPLFYMELHPRVQF